MKKDQNVRAPAIWSGYDNDRTRRGGRTECVEGWRWSKLGSRAIPDFDEGVSRQCLCEVQTSAGTAPLPIRARGLWAKKGDRLGNDKNQGNLALPRRVPATDLNGVDEIITQCEMGSCHLGHPFVQAAVLLIEPTSVVFPIG